MTAALTQFLGIPLPQAFFIGAYTAFLIFAFGYTIWRWRSELSHPVTNPVQDHLFDLSKARLADKERVKVDDYLDRDWHGRKLKVTLKAITELKIEAPKIETEWK